MMKTSEKIAFFPGSFDPFTLGHLSVVRRALSLFDKIVVAIGVNENKHCLYTPQQREAMLQQLFAKEPRVEVFVYEGLTVDAAEKCGATAILRGVRSIADFEYEKNIADLNRDLSGIETVLLFTEPAYAHITSTAVRELIRYGQPVGRFIPEKLQLPVL